MSTLEQIHAELVSIRNLLSQSLPVAKEPAPPVPESLARTLASYNPPRFFKNTALHDQWEWRNDKMTWLRSGANEWVPSIYKTPSQLMYNGRNIIETDEHGNPLEPTAADIAAEKADRDNQIEKDLS